MAVGGLMKRLEEFIAPISDNVTGILCRNHSTEYINALQNGISWAARMHDSSGKIQSGLLSGNVNSLGNFDECLDVRAVQNMTETFSGQHCLATFKFEEEATSDMVGEILTKVMKKENEINMGLGSLLSQGLRWGFCIPSTCTPDDLTTGLKNFMKPINGVEVLVTNEDCHYAKDTPFSVVDFITIAIFATLIIIVLLSTSFEVLRGIFLATTRRWHYGGNYSWDILGDATLARTIRRRQAEVLNGNLRGLAENSQELLLPDNSDEGEIQGSGNRSPQEMCITTCDGASPQQEISHVGSSPQQGMPRIRVSPQQKMLRGGGSPQKEMSRGGGSPQKEIARVGGSPQKEVPRVTTSPQPGIPSGGGIPQQEMPRVRASPQPGMPRGGGSPQQEMPRGGGSPRVGASPQEIPRIGADPQIVQGAETNPHEIDDQSGSSNTQRNTLSNDNELQQSNKYQMLTSFSLLQNGETLFNLENKETTLHSLYGMKFIVLCWVMVAHTFFVTGSLPATNYLSSTEHDKKLFYMLVFHILLAADTFILITSILTSYTFLNDMKKRGIYRRESYEDSGLTLKMFFRYLPMYYLHRFVRLTPVIAAMVLLNASLVQHFGSGPFWTYGSDHLAQPCQENWWSTLTYIQNYFNREQMCVAHSWYYMVDMQLYLLSPFVMVSFLIFTNQENIGIFLAAFSANAMLSFISSYTLHGINDSSGSIASFGGTYYNVQMHYFMGPWIIGLWLGSVLHHKIESGRNRNRCKQIADCCLWMASCIGILLTAMRKLPFGENIPHSSSEYFWYSPYDNVMRNVWALCITWIIYKCETNNGGFLQFVLTWKIFQPLSRLALCIYLIHFPLITCQAFITRFPVYASAWNFVLQFSGNLIMSTILALFLILFIEMPFLSLHKALAKKYNYYFRCTATNSSEYERLNEQESSSSTTTTLAAT